MVTGKSIKVGRVVVVACMAGVAVVGTGVGLAVASDLGIDVGAGV